MGRAGRKVGALAVLLICCAGQDLTFDCSECKTPQVTLDGKLSCKCTMSINSQLYDGNGELHIASTECSGEAQVSGNLDGNTFNQSVDDSADKVTIGTVQLGTRQCDIHLTLNKLAFQENGVFFCPRVELCGLQLNQNTDGAYCVDLHEDDACLAHGCDFCLADARCGWCRSTQKCFMRNSTNPTRDHCGVCELNSFYTGTASASICPTPSPPSPPSPDSRNFDLDCSDCENVRAHPVDGTLTCKCIIKVDTDIYDRTGDLWISSTECSGTARIWGEFDGNDFNRSINDAGDRLTLGSLGVCDLHLTMNRLAFHENGLFFCPQLEFCGVDLNSGNNADTYCVDLHEEDACLAIEDCDKCLADTRCGWCTTTQHCFLRNTTQPSKDFCGVCAGFFYTDPASSAVCPTPSPPDPPADSSNFDIDCSDCENVRAHPIDGTLTCMCKIRVNTDVYDESGTLYISSKECSDEARVWGDFDGNSFDETINDAEDRFSIGTLGIEPLDCDVYMTLNRLSFHENGLFFCPHLEFCGLHINRDLDPDSFCVDLHEEDDCLAIEDCNACVNDNRCGWCTTTSHCFMRNSANPSADFCGVCQNEFLTGSQSSGNCPVPTPSPPGSSPGSPDGIDIDLDCSDCESVQVNPVHNTLTCQCTLRVKSDISSARDGEFTLSTKECSQSAKVWGQFDGTTFNTTVKDADDKVSIGKFGMAGLQCDMYMTLNRLSFHENGVFFCPHFELCGLQLNRDVDPNAFCVDLHEDDACLAIEDCGRCLADTRCGWCADTGHCFLRNEEFPAKDFCGVCSDSYLVGAWNTANCPAPTPSPGTPEPTLDLSGIISVEENRPPIADVCEDYTSQSTCVAHIRCYWTEGSCNHITDPPTPLPTIVNLGGFISGTDETPSPFMGNPRTKLWSETVRVSDGRTTYESGIDKFLAVEQGTNQTGVVALSVLAVFFLVVFVLFIIFMVQGCNAANYTKVRPAQPPEETDGELPLPDYEMQNIPVIPAAATTLVTTPGPVVEGTPVASLGHEFDDRRVSRDAGRMEVHPDNVRVIRGTPDPSQDTISTILAFHEVPAPGRANASPVPNAPTSSFGGVV